MVLINPYVDSGFIFHRQDGGKVLVYEVWTRKENEDGPIIRGPGQAFGVASGVSPAAMTYPFLEQSLILSRLFQISYGGVNRSTTVNREEKTASFESISVAGKRANLCGGRWKKLPQIHYHDFNVKDSAHKL
ncbi:hypothetical protein GH733_000836 [Mirounga leonina]|nr:hypothetical protein GH733_000836 [Mirounga leonina]